MDIPPGSVVISPEKLYDEVMATRHDIGEMRGDFKKVAETLPDHETRIRSLERKVWVAAGVAGGVGAGLFKALSVALGGG